MDCPVCGAPEVQLAEVPYTCFRHQDFATVRPSGRLGQCRRCRLVFNALPGPEIDRNTSVFRSEEYSRSRQTGHRLKVAEFDEPVTRSFLQAELLADLVRPGPARVLDIGCFDGQLLRELARSWPAAERHGFDVNPHLASLFPAGENYRFHAGELEEVEGPFDLICLSHSLCYVKDLGRLVDQTRRLLKPGGAIFIQLPDTSLNPYSLLLCDQYSYFSAPILSLLLDHFGFQGEPVENGWFPREIVSLARVARPREAPAAEPDLMLDRGLDHLARVSHGLGRLGRGEEGLAVLGTTVNAAFVDGVLAEQVRFFVDENPGKVGTAFRGKPVVHPSRLKVSDLVVLPYGQSGLRIKERWERQYLGRFECL